MLVLVGFLMLMTGEPAQKAVVSYTKHQNSMVIRVHINGKGPYKFVLDTGAAMTVVSPATASAAGLTTGGDQVMLIGVGGKPVRGAMSTAREVAVGKAKARRMELVIYPIAHLNKEGISGLIGQDFLERFDLGFDNRKKLLTLSLPGEPRIPKKKPRVLGPMEQLAENVYEDPALGFRNLEETRRILDAFMKDHETGKAPDSQKLADFRADLRKQNSRDSDLYTHLLNQPFHELPAERNARVQKYLYCYRDYADHQNAANRLAALLERQNPDQARISATWQEMQQIADRFGCR